MRVTLEWTDMLKILSKHLGRELDESNVSVRTEPFEIEVCGIDGMEDLRPAPAVTYPAGVRAMPDTSPENDEIVTDQVTRPRGDSADIFTTLQQAREIERELSKLRR